MSKHNVEKSTNLQLEKPEPMEIDEKFPWFMVIMIVIGILTLIGYIVEFIIHHNKYAH